MGRLGFRALLLKENRFSPAPSPRCLTGRTAWPQCTSPATVRPRSATPTTGGLKPFYHSLFRNPQGFLKAEDKAEGGGEGVGSSLAHVVSLPWMKKTPWEPTLGRGKSKSGPRLASCLPSFSKSQAKGTPAPGEWVKPRSWLGSRCPHFPVPFDPHSFLGAFFCRRGELEGSSLR